MEYYFILAFILLIINSIITGIAYLVMKKNNDEVSFFAIFAGVDGVLTLLAGFIALFSYLTEQSMGSGIALGLYGLYYLPVAVVLFIFAIMLHIVTKKSKTID